jgi:hypothetical protein
VILMVGINRRNLEGFVAEFPSEKCMINAIQRTGVEIPEGWPQGKENFIVKYDEGRVLTIQFYDFDTEQEFGEKFEVNYDEVHCWA